MNLNAKNKKNNNKNIKIDQNIENHKNIKGNFHSWYPAFGFYISMISNF